MSGAPQSQATKKLLTSIVYILTLPKFHLATCNQLSHFPCQVHFLLVLDNGFVRGQLVWGLFLESPANFSGPKSNIQIKI